MPKLLVLSGPSGSGKTSVSHILCNQHGWRRSVSVTTRAPRSGEVNDVDYTFVSVEEFNSMKSNGRFIETAYVSNNLYGTPTPCLNTDMPTKLILDVDPQGMRALKQHLDSKEIALTTVFLSVPHDELLRRLTARNQDSQAVISQRMDDFESMMQHSHHYDHVIDNTELSTTVHRILTILGD